MARTSVLPNGQNLGAGRIHFARAYKKQRVPMVCESTSWDAGRDRSVSRHEGFLQPALIKFKLSRGLLQNAVFRPKRKIYLLKKLSRTTTLTVLANFFGDIIFENSILQQALFLFKKIHYRGMGRSTSTWYFDKPVSPEEIVRLDLPCWTIILNGTDQGSVTRK